MPYSRRYSLPPLSAGEKNGGFSIFLTETQRPQREKAVFNLFYTLFQVSRIEVYQQTVRLIRQTKIGAESFFK
jgi:hypothetical protein